MCLETAKKRQTCHLQDLTAVPLVKPSYLLKGPFFQIDRHGHTPKT